MNTLLYAVVPDVTGRASAAFADLEDAIVWGLNSFGGDRFAIRRFETGHAPGPHTARDPDGGAGADR
jgi:hypothetical protein